MDQLIRETQPPVGTPRSPVPQYWNPDTEKYERVLGVHGAPRAMLYGPNGQPISTSNRLPVDVGAQVATESTLAAAVSRLNAILTRLEGTLDVDVGGQIHADVDLGDVTVQIGEVQQGKRGQNAEPWEVTLKGRKVDILVNRTDDNADLSWANNRIALSTIGWRNYASTVGYFPIEIGEYKNLTISIFNELDAGLALHGEVAGIQFGLEIPDRLDRTHWTGTSVSPDTTIPAGGRLNLSPMTLPELENYWRYMTVILRRLAPTTAGTLKIIVAGVRR